MGLTFKKQDDLNKLFDQFAIDPKEKTKNKKKNKDEEKNKDINE